MARAIGRWLSSLIQGYHLSFQDTNTTPSLSWSSKSIPWAHKVSPIHCTIARLRGLPIRHNAAFPCMRWSYTRCCKTLPARVVGALPSMWYQVTENRVGGLALADWSNFHASQYRPSRPWSVPRIIREEQSAYLRGTGPGSVLMGSRNRLLLPGLLNACLRETTHAVTEYHGSLALKATRKASRRRSRAVRAPHKDPQAGLSLLCLFSASTASPT
jgi:hypothetical protein